MHTDPCYLKHKLSPHGLRENTPPDEDTRLLYAFSSTPVNKSKYRGNYISQKIKKLYREARFYSVRNHSDTVSPKKVSNSHSDACFLAYYSKGEKVNYNGRSYRNNMKIACASFSYWWLHEKKPNFDDINSLEKIINNRKIYDLSTIIKHFYSKGCPSVSFYFEIHQFPEILYKVAITLKNKNEQRYSLNSIDHSMGLIIKKSKGNIIIPYYEPNDTLRHKRIIVSTVDDMKTLKCNDFWSPHYQKIFFPENFQIGCLVSIDTTIYRSDCHVECLASPSEYLVHLLHRYGHYGHTSASLCFDGIDEDRKEKLLSGKNQRCVPALFMALQLGHSDATKSYVEDVLESNLRLTVIITLLLGQSIDGSSALAAAFDMGHHEAAKAYIKTVLNSHLDPHIIEMLLIGSTTDGIPALHGTSKWTQ